MTLKVKGESRENTYVRLGDSASKKPSPAFARNTERTVGGVVLTTVVPQR